MVVIVDAKSDTFKFYRGGLLVLPNCSEENHAVVAVGISTDSVIKIRNSHGAQWGENGYFKIKESHYYDKTCFITGYAMQPVVDGALAPAPAPTPKPSPGPPRPAPAPQPTPSPSPSPNPKPSPNPIPVPVIPDSQQVLLYSQCSYYGDSFKTNGSIRDLNMYGFLLGSAVLGSEIKKLSLYIKTDCVGLPLDLKANTQCLKDTNFPYFQTAKSISIINMDVKPGCIIAYTEPCYTGFYSHICSDIIDLGRFTYSNDDYSSIRISPDTLVTIYENANYSGKSYGVNTDIPNLGTIGMDNMVSSLKFTRK